LNLRVAYAGYARKSLNQGDSASIIITAKVGKNLLQKSENHMSEEFFACIAIFDYCPKG
jgi:hypothetical protein